jgi:hypothetical protein
VALNHPSKVPCIVCIPVCYFSLLFLGPFRDVLSRTKDSFQKLGEAGIVYIACFSDAVVRCKIRTLILL